MDQSCRLTVATRATLHRKEGQPQPQSIDAPVPIHPTGKKLTLRCANYGAEAACERATKQLPGRWQKLLNTGGSHGGPSHRRVALKTFGTTDERKLKGGPRRMHEVENEKMRRAAGGGERSKGTAWRTNAEAEMPDPPVSNVIVRGEEGLNSNETWPTRPPSDSMTWPVAPWGPHGLPLGSQVPAPPVRACLELQWCPW